MCAPLQPVFLSYLECTSCGLRHDWTKLQNLCTACHKPLFAKYDLKAVGAALTPAVLSTRFETSLWRYRELMPVPASGEVISLGEGGTPLLQARRYGESVGLHDLWIKDESQNPTQTFKARGMSVAVSMAKHLGATRLAAPSTGNAGDALAAYSARAGLEAHVFFPRDTVRANITACRQLSAKVHFIDGLITDCGAEIARRKAEAGWFEMSTLKEPYRVEGKKTLGYELAEQSGWRLPDVILYPTGGGTGLIGMWKAFDEMEELGWIGKHRPRMFSVQASGCAPIARAFEAGESNASELVDAHTFASGLRVPKAVGDFLMLRILRESNGGAVTVDDREMIAATSEVAGMEGLFVAPEGAACFVAAKKLVSSGKIDAKDRVVIFNTGAGVKYLDSYPS